MNTDFLIVDQDHPTDPIAYRLEPLVSKAMAELKSQPLPYVKKGFILRNQLSGLTGISQKVSNMWSSLSSGIASSILNRSLGISGDGSSPAKDKKDEPLSFEALDTDVVYKPTLIDDDLETLYAGFQKRGKLKETSIKSEDKEGDIGTAQEDTVEEQSRYLRREEWKVRKLNRTGRIDFSIQEGTFDLSLVGSIAR